VRAIILIKSPRNPIADKVAKLKGVKEAFNVYGRFDAIALVETKDLSEIKKLVLEIQKIEGVRRTETLINVE